MAFLGTAKLPRRAFLTFNRLPISFSPHAASTTQRGRDNSMEMLAGGRRKATGGNLPGPHFAFAFGARSSRACQKAIPALSFNSTSFPILDLVPPSWIQVWALGALFPWCREFGSGARTTNTLLTTSRGNWSSECRQPKLASHTAKDNTNKSEKV